MNKKTLTKADLSQFTGTEVWFRHELVKSVLYTEGVQYMAEVGGAYWLVDEIAFSQSKPKVKAESFQFWKLTVDSDRTATLSCEDGNGNIVYIKQIEYTDFPLNEMVLYYTDNVILLTSEY